MALKIKTKGSLLHRLSNCPCFWPSNHKMLFSWWTWLFKFIACHVVSNFWFVNCGVNSLSIEFFWLAKYMQKNTPTVSYTWWRLCASTRASFYCSFKDENKFCLYLENMYWKFYSIALTRLSRTSSHRLKKKTCRWQRPTWSRETRVCVNCGKLMNIIFHLNVVLDIRWSIY